MKPSPPVVFHVGCDGRVRVQRSPDGGPSRMVCDRCSTTITDPLELSKRGSGFNPREHGTRVIRWDSTEI